ncbi:MAG: hypothetical protein J7J51_02420 [Candidatus Omnitrophica bacterium]|nr:hypothetical protein [Candidatus Omnitrophota bacterium]
MKSAANEPIYDSSGKLIYLPSEEVPSYIPSLGNETISENPLEEDKEPSLLDRIFAIGGAIKDAASGVYDYLAGGVSSLIHPAPKESKEDILQTIETQRKLAEDSLTPEDRIFLGLDSLPFGDETREVPEQKFLSIPSYDIESPLDTFEEGSKIISYYLSDDGKSQIKVTVDLASQTVIEELCNLEGSSLSEAVIQTTYYMSKKSEESFDVVQTLKNGERVIFSRKGSYDNKTGEVRFTEGTYLNNQGKVIGWKEGKIVSINDGSNLITYDYHSQEGFDIGRGSDGSLLIYKDGDLIIQSKGKVEDYQIEAGEGEIEIIRYSLYKDGEFIPLSKPMREKIKPGKGIKITAEGITSIYNLEGEFLGIDVGGKHFTPEEIEKINYLKKIGYLESVNGELRLSSSAEQRIGDYYATSELYHIVQHPEEFGIEKIKYGDFGEDSGSGNPYLDAIFAGISAITEVFTKSTYTAGPIKSFDLIIDKNNLNNYQFSPNPDLQTVNIPGADMEVSKTGIIPFYGLIAGPEGIYNLNPLEEEALNRMREQSLRYGTIRETIPVDPQGKPMSPMNWDLWTEMHKDERVGNHYGYADFPTYSVVDGVFDLALLAALADNAIGIEGVDEAAVLAAKEAFQAGKISTRQYLSSGIKPLIKQGAQQSLKQLPKDMLLGGSTFVAADNVISWTLDGQLPSLEQNIHSFKSGAALQGGLRFAGIGAGTTLKIAGATNTGARLSSRISGVSSRYASKPLTYYAPQDAAKLTKIKAGSKATLAKPFIHADKVGKEVIRAGLPQDATAAKLLSPSFKKIAGFTAIGPAFTTLNIGIESAIEGELTWPGKKEGLSLRQAYITDAANFAKMGTWLPQTISISSVPHTVAKEGGFLNALSREHSLSNLVRSVKNPANAIKSLEEKAIRFNTEKGLKVSLEKGITALDSAAFIASTLSGVQHLSESGLQKIGFSEAQAEYLSNKAAFASLVFIPAYYNPFLLSTAPLPSKAGIGSRIKQRLSNLFKEKNTPQGLRFSFDSDRIKENQKFGKEIGDKLNELIALKNSGRQIPEDILKSNKITDRIALSFLQKAEKMGKDFEVRPDDQLSMTYALTRDILRSVQGSRDSRSFVVKVFMSKGKSAAYASAVESALDIAPAKIVIVAPNIEIINQILSEPAMQSVAQKYGACLIKDAQRDIPKGNKVYLMTDSTFKDFGLAMKYNLPNGEFLNGINKIIVDEPQVVLANPDKVVSSREGVLRRLSPQMQERLSEEYSLREKIYSKVEENANAIRTKGEEPFLCEVPEEIARSLHKSPEFRTLSYSLFKYLLDSAATIYKYGDKAQYYKSEDGKSFSVAGPGGRNEPGTIFGEREMSIFLGIKEKLGREKAMEDFVASSNPYRISFTEIISRLGKNKFVGGSGTTDSIDGILKEMGFDILEFSREPIFKTGPTTKIIFAEKDLPTSLGEVVKKAFREGHNKVVITDKRGQMLERYERALKSDEGISQDAEIILIEGREKWEEGMEYAARRCQEYPQEKTIVLAQEIETGLNLLATSKKGDYKAVVIKTDISSKDIFKQFAARVKTKEMPEIEGRVEGRVYFMIDPKEVENLGYNGKNVGLSGLTDADKLALSKAKDPAEKQEIILNIAERISREINKKGRERVRRELSGSPQILQVSKIKHQWQTEEIGNIEKEMARYLGRFSKGIDMFRKPTSQIQRETIERHLSEVLEEELSAIKKNPSLITHNRIKNIISLFDDEDDEVRQLALGNLFEMLRRRDEKNSLLANPEEVEEIIREFALKDEGYYDRVKGIKREPHFVGTPFEVIREIAREDIDKLTFPVVKEVLKIFKKDARSFIKEAFADVFGNLPSRRTIDDWVEAMVERGYSQEDVLRGLRGERYLYEDELNAIAKGESIISSDSKEFSDWLRETSLATGKSEEAILSEIEETKKDYAEREKRKKEKPVYQLGENLGKSLKHFGEQIGGSPIGKALSLAIPLGIGILYLSSPFSGLIAGVAAQDNPLDMQGDDTKLAIDGEDLTSIDTFSKQEVLLILPTVEKVNIENLLISLDGDGKDSGGEFSEQIATPRIIGEDLSPWDDDYIDRETETGYLNIYLEVDNWADYIELWQADNPEFEDTQKKIIPTDEGHRRNIKVKLKDLTEDQYVKFVAYRAGAAPSEESEIIRVKVVKKDNYGNPIEPVEEPIGKLDTKDSHLGELTVELEPGEEPNIVTTYKTLIDAKGEPKTIKIKEDITDYPRFFEVMIVDTESDNKPVFTKWAPVNQKDPHKIVEVEFKDERSGKSSWWDVEKKKDLPDGKYEVFARAHYYKDSSTGKPPSDWVSLGEVEIERDDRFRYFAPPPEMDIEETKNGWGVLSWSLPPGAKGVVLEVAKKSRDLSSHPNADNGKDTQRYFIPRDFTSLLTNQEGVYHIATVYEKPDPDSQVTGKKILTYSQWGGLHSEHNYFQKREGEETISIETITESIPQRKGIIIDDNQAKIFIKDKQDKLKFLADYELDDNFEIKTTREEPLDKGPVHIKHFTDYGESEFDTEQIGNDIYHYEKGLKMPDGTPFWTEVTSAIDKDKVIKTAEPIIDEESGEIIGRRVKDLINGVTEIQDYYEGEYFTTEKTVANGETFNYKYKDYEGRRFLIWDNEDGIEKEHSYEFYPLEKETEVEEITKRDWPGGPEQKGWKSNEKALLKVKTWTISFNDGRPDVVKHYDIDENLLMVENSDATISIYDRLNLAGFNQPVMIADAQTGEIRQKINYELDEMNVITKITKEDLFEGQTEIIEVDPVTNWKTVTTKDNDGVIWIKTPSMEDGQYIETKVNLRSGTEEKLFFNYYGGHIIGGAEFDWNGDEIRHWEIDGNKKIVEYPRIGEREEITLAWKYNGPATEGHCFDRLGERSNWEISDDGYTKTKRFLRLGQAEEVKLAYRYGPEIRGARSDDLGEIFSWKIGVGQDGKWHNLKEFVRTGEREDAVLSHFSGLPEKIDFIGSDGEIKRATKFRDDSGDWFSQEIEGKKKPLAITEKFDGWSKETVYGYLSSSKIGPKIIETEFDSNGDLFSVLNLQRDDRWLIKEEGEDKGKYYGKKYFVQEGKNEDGEYREYEKIVFASQDGAKEKITHYKWSEEEQEFVEIFSKEAVDESGNWLIDENTGKHYTQIDFANGRKQFNVHPWIGSEVNEFSKMLAPDRQTTLWDEQTYFDEKDGKWYQDKNIYDRGRLIKEEKNILLWHNGPLGDGTIVEHRYDGDVYFDVERDYIENYSKMTETIRREDNGERDTIKWERILGNWEKIEIDYSDGTGEKNYFDDNGIKIKKEFSRKEFGGINNYVEEFAYPGDKIKGTVYEMHSIKDKFVGERTYDNLINEGELIHSIDILDLGREQRVEVKYQPDGSILHYRDYKGVNLPLLGYTDELFRNTNIDFVDEFDWQHNKLYTLDLNSNKKETFHFLRNDYYLSEISRVDYQLNDNSLKITAEYDALIPLEYFQTKLYNENMEPVGGKKLALIYGSGIGLMLTAIGLNKKLKQTVLFKKTKVVIERVFPRQPQPWRATDVAIVLFSIPALIGIFALSPTWSTWAIGGATAFFFTTLLVRNLSSDFVPHFGWNPLKWEWFKKGVFHPQKLSRSILSCNIGGPILNLVLITSAIPLATYILSALALPSEVWLAVLFAILWPIKSLYKSTMRKLQPFPEETQKAEWGKMAISEAVLLPIVYFVLSMDPLAYVFFTRVFCQGLGFGIDVRYFLFGSIEITRGFRMGVPGRVTINGKRINPKEAWERWAIENKIEDAKIVPANIREEILKGCLNCGSCPMFNKGNSGHCGACFGASERWHSTIKDIKMGSVHKFIYDNKKSDLSQYKYLSPQHVQYEFLEDLLAKAGVEAPGLFLAQLFLERNGKDNNGNTDIWQAIEARTKKP